MILLEAGTVFTFLQAANTTQALSPGCPQVVFAADISDPEQNHTQHIQHTNKWLQTVHHPQKVPLPQHFVRRVRVTLPRDQAQHFIQTTPADDGKDKLKKRCLFFAGWGGGVETNRLCARDQSSV